MFRTSIKSLVALPAMASVLLLTACQASGGGTLQSANSCSNDAQNRATFGFNASQDFLFDQVTFAGTYTDRCAGVMLRTTGKLSPMSPPLSTPTPPFSTPTEFKGCLFGTTSYDSINPSRPGTGTLTLEACDRSDPANPLIPGTADTDFFSIVINDGPYTDYRNQGFLAVGQGRQSQTPGVGTGNIVVKQ